MKNLLNAVNFFGKYIDWNAMKTAVWLIIIQALLIVIAISLIIYVILRRRLRQQTANVVYTVAQPTTQETEVVPVAEPVADVERELMGISLDLGVVKREFVAGDEFDCEGLVVLAEYNVSPTTESLVDYTLIENDTYTRLERKDKLEDTVYVITPYMNIAGKKVVTVKYEGQTAAYTIAVDEYAAPVEEQPEPEVEETAAPVEPIVVEIPVEDKLRELMSISINTDNVQKEYTVGDAINDEGLVVTGHYSIEPLEEEIADYSVLPPDMSKPGKPTVTITYQGKTVGYRITVNPAEVEEEPAPVVEEQAEPIIVEQQPTVIVQQHDPIIVEEESVSSRLRYDKSFTARLIQSDDETKYWYTDLKNDLLGYKSVHGRISWKRETFKCHKDVVAKFAYRGKVLCVYLPLNPYDYMDKHPVENAADMSCYEDTPLMVRLKSAKRVRLVKDLIRTVMENKGIDAVPHETVDYYMPYEGILELINKGLIKREIKTPEDEAIFETGGAVEPQISEADEDETFALEEVAPGIYVTKKD